MTDDLNHVPLDERHRELGAEMTEFGGFSMPVTYEGITDEHHAVRNDVGLFDVSHMGEIEVRGPEAIRVVDGLITNDAASLANGRAQYTAMCNEQGGIVDDLVWYRLGDERALLCVNAANRQKDWEHVTAHAEGDAELLNRSDDYVQLALQGPNAEALLQAIAEADLEELGFFRTTVTPVAGVETLVTRTGYTGEDGFELYYDSADAVAVFDALVEAGGEFDLGLCGLGARDTLRLEAMLNLYGQDMTEENNPYEARLGWTVKLDKETPFVGQEALEQIAEEGPDKKLRGFILEGRGVIRPDYPIFVDDEPVGEITSGGYAPTLEESIGLGYIDADHTDESEVDIEMRGRRVPARVTNDPFYER